MAAGREGGTPPTDHEHATEQLVPLGEVQQLVLARVAPLAVVSLPLLEALGCVLAEDVLVPEDIPPFVNSAMDGYAVRSGDTQDAPAVLAVKGVLPAGAEPPGDPLGAGEALQIMTGAAMPAGADAVAIVERTERLGADAVRVLDAVPSGANVRPAGSDYEAGALAVPSGTRLGPIHLGVLASVGKAAVDVWRRPVVGVMSTGDELVEAGVPLRAGQIRDSNRTMLLSLLRRDGFAVEDLGTVPDREEAVARAVAQALSRCDAVLSSGGVSKGEYDYVKVVLDRLASSKGGESLQLGVDIRPAKPLALAWLPRPSGTADGAQRQDGPLVAFFGLPGNPVSAVVSYRMIALPALRKMAGAEAPIPFPIWAVAGEALQPSRDGRLNLVRVRLSTDDSGRLVARSSGGQQSHQLSGLAGADALALVPRGDPVAEGGLVQVVTLGGPD